MSDEPSDGRGVASMQIGEGAARTELSLRSLRHWEEVGLVRPSGRSDGGFRLYAESDVEKILVVRRMKPLGFSIEEMRAVMDDLETLRDESSSIDQRAVARAHLEGVRAEARERRGRLERQLGMADEFIALLDGEVTSAQTT